MKFKPEESWTKDELQKAISSLAKQIAKVFRMPAEEIKIKALVLLKAEMEFYQKFLKAIKKKK